jgi:dTDP-4-dehydrorhamnose reductase
MKLLITVANGQLGRCLQDRAQAYGFNVVAVSHEQLDISDKSAVDLFFSQFQPELVINAAAYTAVDKAEIEPNIAYEVNVTGPKNLAEACQLRNIPMFHISTDYVFDGSSTKPYKPLDQTCPQSVYGGTKLAGEQIVAQICTKHVIVRTAWVFSEYGNNFVKTMLRLAGDRAELSVVADQYGCPTYAGDIAEALLKMATAINKKNDWSGYGIHHFCGDQATSWHGFARAIMAEGIASGLLTRIPTVKAIPSADYPTPAKRPEYSVLDCSSYPVSQYNRCWRTSLVNVIDRIVVNSSL